MLFHLVNLFVYLRHPNQIRRFLKRTGRFPNAAFPRTVQEKFLWRKIFDHNPLFTEVSDKLRAKDLAARLCPDLRSPRVLWQGLTAEDIPEQLLLGTDVLKANHGCNFNIFLPRPERARLARITAKWLARPYGRKQGEWAYRDIQRRLFIEERIASPSGKPLAEYKVHTCAGKAVWIFFIVDRSGGTPSGSLFLPDGRCIRDSGIKGFVEGADRPPDNLGMAIEFAEKLGAQFDYLRCDILECDGALFFNELTVYPQTGSPWNRDAEILKRWSESWDLTRSWFLSSPQSGWRARYATALRHRLREETAMKIAEYSAE